MTTVHVCDRCGKVYDFSYIENMHHTRVPKNRFTSRLVAYLEPNDHKMVEIADIELCPNCVQSLRNWIDNPEVSGDNNS